MGTYPHLPDLPEDVAVTGTDLVGTQNLNERHRFHLEKSAILEKMRRCIYLAARSLDLTTVLLGEGPRLRTGSELVVSDLPDCRVRVSPPTCAASTDMRIVVLHDESPKEFDWIDTKAGLIFSD